MIDLRNSDPVEISIGLQMGREGRMGQVFTLGLGPQRLILTLV